MGNAIDRPAPFPRNFFTLDRPGSLSMVTGSLPATTDEKTTRGHRFETARPASNAEDPNYADAHIGGDSVERRCKPTRSSSDEEPELRVRPIGEDLSLRRGQRRAPRTHVPLQLRLFLILHTGRPGSGSRLREQVMRILRRPRSPG